MNERTLIERLNIPWPEHETEEVTLPAWVIELCAEGAARITALEAQLAKAKAENELLREVLANMIGHARWVTDEFDAHLAYLTECEATLTTTGATHE